MASRELAWFLADSEMLGLCLPVPFDAGEDTTSWIECPSLPRHVLTRTAVLP
jgi:hypothetical protein